VLEIFKKNFDLYIIVHNKKKLILFEIVYQTSKENNASNTR